MSKLNREKVLESLSDFSGWKFIGNRIEKKFSFDTYMAGIDFVYRLAKKAEKHNHHPNIEVGWCNVKVMFASHDAGGVTERDIKMAGVTENSYEESEES